MCGAFARRVDAEWEAECKAEGLQSLNLFLCSTYSINPEKNVLEGKGLSIVLSDSKSGRMLMQLLVAAMKQNDEFRRLLEDAVMAVNS